MQSSKEIKDSAAAILHSAMGLEGQVKDIKPGMSKFLDATQADINYEQESERGVLRGDALADREFGTSAVQEFLFGSGEGRDKRAVPYRLDGNDPHYMSVYHEDGKRFILNGVDVDTNSALIQEVTGRESTNLMSLVLTDDQADAIKEQAK